MLFDAYLSETSLLGFLQSEDSSTLQQTAERQTLALADGRHLPLSAQATVNLMELQQTAKSAFQPSNTTEAAPQRHLLDF